MNRGRKAAFRCVPPALACLGIGALCLSPGHAQAAPAPVALGVSGQAYPRFMPGIEDYVTRCPRGRVHVSVRARHRVEITIGAVADRFVRRLSATVPLKPGGEVTVALRDRGERNRRAYHIRCLPPDFPKWSWVRNQPPGRAFYLVTPSLRRESVATDPGYLAIFDRHGVPVWWFRAGFPPMDAKLLPDGTIAFAQYGGTTYADPENTAHYQIRALNGLLLRRVQTASGLIDHHDLQPDGRGGFYVLTYTPRPNVDLSPYGGPSDAWVVDAEVQQLNRRGELVWSWNSKDHISLDETGRWWPLLLLGDPATGEAPRVYDPVHVNSVDARRGKVVLSMRHTDAVYQVDKGSGEIDWKLGGSATPESLSVIGDPFAAEPFGGQHDARLLTDGTLTVFDNASLLGRPPRAVRYRLDTGARTATLLEDVRDPLAPNSFCCGSARRAGDGSWLVSWGGRSLVSEFAANGRRAFRFRFRALFSYRAVGIGAGRLDIGRLRRAMDRMHQSG